MQRWERLYYCYRDDCVFVPDEGTYAPPSRMIEYLGLATESPQPPGAPPPTPAPKEPPRPAPGQRVDKNTGNLVGR